MKKSYFINYFNQFSEILSNYDEKDFLKIVQILREIKKKNKKVILVGNGGSAAMASHVSVDLTKIGKIRAINFNEADLLTCFSNDYGYENWVQKAMFFYADKGDLVICISSSGQSKNIIKGAKFAKKTGIFLFLMNGCLTNKLVLKPNFSAFATASSVVPVLLQSCLNCLKISRS